MESGRWKEFMLQTGGAVERLGNGVRMLRDGGGIICYDKEVV